MGEITPTEKDKIWEEVRKEFPDDEMMQELHFIRQVHYQQTKDMSLDERLRFYSGERRKTSV